MADQKKEDPRSVSDDCIDIIDALCFSLRPRLESDREKARLDRIHRDLKAITFGQHYGSPPSAMLGAGLRRAFYPDAVNKNGDALEFKTVKARKGSIGELIEKWRRDGVKQLGAPLDIITGLMAMHSGREAAAQMCHDINYSAKISWHGIDLIPVPEMERDRFAGVRMMTEEEVERIKEWKPLRFNFHLDKPAQIRGLKADMVLTDEVQEFQAAEELQRKSLADMHLAGKISDTTLLKQFGIETGERGDDMEEDLELCCVRGCENEGVHSTIFNGTQQGTMCEEHWAKLRGTEVGKVRSKSPNIQELPRDGSRRWMPPPGTEVRTIGPDPFLSEYFSPTEEVKPDYTQTELMIAERMKKQLQEDEDRRMKNLILADMNRGSRPAYMEPPSYVNTPADRTALYSHYCDRHPEAKQLASGRSAFACSELDNQVRYRKQTDVCPICAAIERGELDPDKVRGHHEHSLEGTRRMIAQKLSAMGLTGSKNQMMVDALIKRLREVDEEAARARADQAKFLGEVAADSMARSIAEAEDIRILREVEEKLRRKEEWEQAPNQSIINDLRGKGFPVDGIPEPKLRLPTPESSSQSDESRLTGSDRQGAIEEETRYYKQRCEAADAYAASAVGKREQIKKLQEEVAELEKDRSFDGPTGLNDWLKKPMGSF